MEVSERVLRLPSEFVVFDTSLLPETDNAACNISPVSGFFFVFARCEWMPHFYWYCILVLPCLELEPDTSPSNFNPDSSSSCPASELVPDHSACKFGPELELVRCDVVRHLRWEFILVLVSLELSIVNVRCTWIMLFEVEILIAVRNLSLEFELPGCELFLFEGIVSFELDWWIGCVSAVGGSCSPRRCPRMRARFGRGHIQFRVWVDILPAVFCFVRQALPRMGARETLTHPRQSFPIGVHVQYE